MSTSSQLVAKEYESYISHFTSKTDTNGTRLEDVDIAALEFYFDHNTREKLIKTFENQLVFDDLRMANESTILHLSWLISFIIAIFNKKFLSATALGLISSKFLGAAMRYFNNYRPNPFVENEHVALFALRQSDPKDPTITFNDFTDENLIKRLKKFKEYYEHSTTSVVIREFFFVLITIGLVALTQQAGRSVKRITDTYTQSRRSTRTTKQKKRYKK